MIETNKTKSRRKFIEDGLRAIALSGLTFVGLALGWRKDSASAGEAPCAVDLPCRICSKLPGCRKIKARETKREYQDSLIPSVSKMRGLE